MKFKRETGITPIEYMNTFRLDTASHLLFDRNLTVSRAAEMCGCETSTISEIFQKRLKKAVRTVADAVQKE